MPLQLQVIEADQVDRFKDWRTDPNRRFEAGGFERISERFRRDAERPKDASGAPSDSRAIVRRAARQIGEMSR